MNQDNPSQVTEHRRLITPDPDSLSGNPVVVQNMLQGVLDQMRTAVFFYDAQWRLVFVNGLGKTMLEVQDASPIGKTIWEWNPTWGESSPFFEMIRHAATERMVASHRDWVPRLQGWFDLVTYPTEGGVAIYVHDITAEETAQQELTATLKRLRRKADLLDASRDAVYVRELDNTITYWNRGAERLYGWTAEEIAGRSTRDFLYGNVEDFDAATAQLLETGSWMGDLTQRTKDGRVFTADCRWQLVRDSRGTPLHVLCNISHEREQLRDQERQYRAQRLESLGLLAGGIAHNLNNVLAPLLLTAQFVAANESNPALKELLHSMEPTIRRGSEMIAQVLTYSRGEEGQRSKVDARLLITELENFCRDALARSVTVHSETNLEFPFFVGDSTQVMQVLVNLATNARDAMPSGGKFMIRAYNHDIPLESQDGGFGRGIAIEAIDSGPGMAAETVTRAFEPFYSTKELGKGTGLGLSTSLAIAHGHGGELTILSAPGQGTRIQLLLPATDEEATPLAPPPPIDTAPVEALRKTVLVVDDEAPLRAIVQATLESHGYVTLGAAHGKEAVTLIENGENRLDLVFTDMMMPEMDGKELEAYLYEHYPELPVIAASGFSTGSDLTQALRGGTRRFLAKPFSTDELLDAVKKELPTDD